jgi:hypothetical protein
MVTEGSPSLFAHAAAQPFQAVEGYPFPPDLSTMAHSGSQGRKRGFRFAPVPNIFLLFPIFLLISANLPGFSVDHLPQLPVKMA